jgi:hypothetical protein
MVPADFVRNQFIQNHHVPFVLDVKVAVLLNLLPGEKIING